MDNGFEVDISFGKSYGNTAAHLPTKNISIDNKEGGDKQRVFVLI